MQTIAKTIKVNSFNKLSTDNLSLPANAKFGAAVANDTNILIVGTTGANSQKGSAIVYQRSPFGPYKGQSLTASDGASGDEFGSSVAISSKTALVGASNKNNGTGAAYVYELNAGNWKEVKLVASDGQVGDRFGGSLLISASRAIVGAKGCDANKGAVYVFDKQQDGSWVQSKIQPGDGASYDEFGAQLSQEGNTLYISAPGKNNGGGAVYVYELTGSNWTLQKTLLSTDSGLSAGISSFGQSLSVHQNSLLIGASHLSKNHFFVATVPADLRGSYSYQEIPAVSTDFGLQAAISTEGVVVGTNGANREAANAFVFRLAGTSWKNISILADPIGMGPDSDQQSLSICGDTVLIGHPLDRDQQTPNVGGARLFIIGANVYLRDNFKDNGSVPSFGSLCESPGIIPQNSLVKDPQKEFGGINWNNSYRHNVTPGSEVYFYVRAENIGDASITPTVHLFWSPAASFNHPGIWLKNKIGSQSLGEVKPGEKIVSGPIKWKATDKYDHFCIIGYLSNSGTPFLTEQEINEIKTSDQFYNFVQFNNNFVLHNVTSVSTSTMNQLDLRSFYMTTLARGEEYHLILETNLPSGVEVKINCRTDVGQNGQGFQHRPEAAKETTIKTNGLSSYKCFENIAINDRKRIEFDLNDPQNRLESQEPYVLKFIQIHAQTNRLMGAMRFNYFQ